MKVSEFDPVIYPTRLWVAVAPTKDDIEKTFLILDENDEEKDVVTLYTSPTIMNTASVAHRKSTWMGCLVSIVKPKDCTVGVIAHEASHCTDWLCDHLGVSGFSFMDGEARAYYTQWVANCIYKVLKGKI